MIRCQSCGQDNSGGSNFCRFCGFKFQQNQTDNPPVFGQTPPRPYSWKTDEFQLEESPKSRPTQQIDRVQPNANLQPNDYQTNVTPRPAETQRLQPHHQNTLSTGYHCPFCNSNALPVVVKKVSPAGWAVFTVLLITTFIFFWIGLLIQEERRICPVCNSQVS